MRLLRALISATLLLVLNSVAQAQTFTQLQWGIARGSSPMPICVMNAAACATQVGTVQSNGTFIPSGVVINIQNYIAAGETTIDNALTRADAVLTTFGGGILRFPNQSSCYVQTGTHTITAGNITYQGDGFGTCINVAVNGDFFRIGDGTANPHNNYIKNLTLNPSGVKTTGAAIRFRNSFGAGASDIICGGTLNVCIDVDGGTGATLVNQYLTKLERINCFGGVSCVRLGNAAGEAQETWIIDSSPAGQTTAGVEIINAGGTHLRQNSYLANLHAMYVHPSTGQFATGIDSLNEIMDSSWDSCLLLDASGGGQISEGVFTSLWSSTCSRTVGSHTGTNNPAVWLKGTTTTLLNMQFPNIRAINSGGTGFQADGGIGIYASGIIAMNSVNGNVCNGNTTACPGALFAANLTSFGFWGRSGGPASSLPGPDKQSYGAIVAVGTSDNYTIDGDFTGNATGDVLDGGTGGHKYVRSVGGNLAWAGTLTSFVAGGGVSHTFAGTSRDSTFGNSGAGIFNITTGTGQTTDEGLRCGVHDGDYSWCQASKPGTANRNLALQPSGGSVGIGNTAPGTTFDVTGTIRGSAAPIFTALTGYVFCNAASICTAASTVPLSSLAAQAANTIVANGTAGSAAPTALGMPSCSTTRSALLWTTSGGVSAVTCNTTIVASTADTWTTARNLAGNSVNGSANVAFSNKFIVQGTTDPGLSGAQFLGALGTGLVKNTTTTGVLSIATAGTDYLTSVGATFTGGLISISGSPLTVNGTLGFTVAGTSGGIPYFSSTSAWASSALLSSGSIMLGGGAGNPPTTTTTGTGVVTALGINVGTAGAFVTNGGALGTPSSGTLTNATGLPYAGISAVAPTSYTPTVTTNGGSPTFTSPTGDYIQIGKQVCFRAQVTQSVAGTGFITMSLPVAPSLTSSLAFSGVGEENVTSGTLLYWTNRGSDTTARVTDFAGSYPTGGVGARFNINGCYFAS